MRSLLLALALALLALPGHATAADETPPPRIYRWVDENGIAHYTTDPERIPKSLRRRFGLPAQPLTAESLDAHAPGRDGPDAWAGQEKSAEPVHPAPRQLEPGKPATTASEPRELTTGGSPGDRLAQLELRIAELSAAIAADEDTLAAFVGDPDQGDAVEVGDTPEFRTVAERLPKRFEELAALRAERDALASQTVR